MNASIVWAVVLNEVRLRMRRTSTLVALLAVVALSWAMIADPAGGNALIVADGARVLYTSTALAVGSASLGSLLFGLGGFYLVRGRIAEDIRSGTGSVIGATPAGNALFLFTRWLGSVACLGAMVLAFMLTILVLHAVRGEGPIEPLAYLLNYALLLFPLTLFTASCATLFDSWAPLMGKRGDVLFFVLWACQLGLVLPVSATTGMVPLVELFDFNGLGATMLAVSHALGTTHVAMGGGDFKAALAPVTLPRDLWSAPLVALRCATALLALLPLLVSVFVFHRFSPDRIKPSGGGKRRSPLALVNNALKPASALAAPLFRLAARIPGMPGQILGDVALTLAAAPSAMAAVLAAAFAALAVPPQGLGAALIPALAFWGVLVSDISTRDFAAGTEGMTGAVGGGASRRYWRQFCATVLLGLMFAGVVALRWSFAEPLRALALAGGVASFAALATAFGRVSRSALLFMALFLFWLYVAINGGRIAMLDAAGFTGSASMQSVGAWLAAGALALAAGGLWNRRQAA